MNYFKIFSLIFGLFVVLSFTGGVAEAKLNVVTTIPDLAAVVSEVGGEYVLVQSISKGTQDPHFIEAKPSYMVKVNHADLVVSMGLELEIGWLPPILNGARNPKVMPGTKGYLELGSDIDPIEVTMEKVSRAGGDVHPFGNPHFNLDPLRMGVVAVKIAERLGELEPEHAAIYADNAKKLKLRMEEKTKKWQVRINKTGIKEVITYHKTLDYFFNRFGIKNSINLEPKPGIPPTAQHILEVIGVARDRKIKLIMVENYFDTSFSDKITREIPGSRVVIIPVEVSGNPFIKTLDDLYENLVMVMEAK